jgi:hypothetical protein
MTSSEKTPPRKRKGDVTAFALMIGMILAVAVTSGASFSAAGSGALQQTLRSLGFGRDTEIQTAQRKQATTLAEIERIIARMDKEIGTLTMRIAETAESEGEAQEGLAQLSSEFAALSTEVRDLRARTEATGHEAWRRPVDHLNAAVAGARGDIITLRSSLDAYEQMRRSDLGAITRRIDRLEKAIATRDATASIAPTQPPRAGEAPSSGGLRDLFGLRGSGSTTSEPGTGHVIDMGVPAH